MRKAAALSGNHEGNDQVLRETRWLSVIIVPFLLAAFGILYLFTGHTQELFAWNIKPRMTSMMLGAAYLGGVYFFVRAALATRWHWIQVGFRAYLVRDVGGTLLYHAFPCSCRLAAQSEYGSWYSG